MGMTVLEKKIKVYPTAAATRKTVYQRKVIPSYHDAHCHRRIRILQNKTAVQRFTPLNQQTPMKSKP